MGISEERADKLRYVAGRVNCVERKAGIVLETPKSAFAHQKQGCDEKLPERRKSEKKKVRTK